ncbi:MAG: hypothetical protein WAK20_19145 [Candidatus Acidiferrum sp.]
MEAWTGKADADYLLAVGERLTDMNHLSLRFEIGILAPDGPVLMRDANLEIAADRHVEARPECGPATAEIFTRGFFFKGKSARVFSSNS